MITENLSTLKIHKISQAQYERELEAGRIDENALYLTPDKEVDLSNYATKDDVENIEFPVYAAEESVDTSVEIINADTLQGFKADAFRKSDWVPSAADVGAVPAIVVGGDTLTWDGNTEGLVSLPMEGLGCLYKVSDTVPGENDLAAGASMTWGFGTNLNTMDCSFDKMMDGIFMGPDGFVMIVAENGINVDLGGVSFSEAGTYFMILETGIQIFSLTINGYTGFGSKSIAHDYMPTAEQVGARPADWLPTIAEIGAAPAGYVDERGQYTDYTSALAQIKSVYASMGDRTKRCLFIDILNLDSTNFPTGSYFVEIYREWENYGTIVFTSSAYIKIVIRIAGSFGDFCYENPPMVVGAEYRTTERWQGSVVYTTIVNFGNMPNNSTASVSIANLKATGILSCRGVTNKGDTIPYSWSGEYMTEVSATVNNIYLYTRTNVSDSIAYITLKYIKA